MTHFYAENKLICAVADGKAYCVDHSIAGLAQRLDPRPFIRIHRGTLLNVDWLKDMALSVGGKFVGRLKDAGQTELIVARNRVHELKARLGC